MQYLPLVPAGVAILKVAGLANDLERVKSGGTVITVILPLTSIILPVTSAM